MDGKRFGVGLVAGLLLGVAIVAASSGLPTGSLYGSFGPAGQYSVATSATSTSAVTATNSATSTYPIGGTILPPGMNTTKGISTTTSTPVEAVNGGNSSTTFASLASSLSSLSSDVDSMPHQPLVSNAVVFIPIFVAFLLGAVLYRASRPKDEEED